MQDFITNEVLKALKLKHNKVDLTQKFGMTLGACLKMKKHARFVKIVVRLELRFLSYPTIMFVFEADR